MPDRMEFANGRVFVQAIEIGSTGMRCWDEADGTRVYLLTGGVAPQYRGRGYGRRILAWQEEQVRLAGAPDHAALAWAGDRLVGWVLSGRSDTPWVGVRPAWRRRGLASALLRVNHAALWNSGVRRSSLWTVLENPTGSVGLYRRVGHRIVERQPRYRKRLGRADGTRRT